MPIHDALWACPFCRRIESIRPGKKGEACSGCAATFEAGPGATIVGRAANGPPVTRSLEGWEKVLPPLDDAAATDPGSAPAIIREAESPRPVYAEARLLGWAERFGPKTRATVELAAGVLLIRTRNGPETTWSLEETTAVQPSSSSVQLRRRDGKLLSLAFPEGCVRLWEARLQAAVRICYRAAGKGEVVEYHPTIRTR